MKWVIRTFAIEALALYLVTQIATGFVFAEGLNSMATTIVALTIASFLVKPVINLFLLPINLMTFGIFRWISHAIMLYLVDLILPDFNIIGFNFNGFNGGAIFIPAMSFGPGALSYVAFSFLLSVAIGLIYWVVD